MPVVVKEDLIRGSKLHQTLTSIELFRVFNVSGLEAAYPLPYQRIGGGKVAISPYVQLGVPYPDPNFDAAICVDIQSTFVSNDKIDFIAIYRQEAYLPGFLKSFSGTLRQINVYTDFAGNKAQVTYTPAEGSPTILPVPIAKLVEDDDLTFKFREAMDPEYVSKLYKGAVNKFLWRGYPPRTLRLLPIVGSTLDGVWYDNQYTLLYNEITHDEFTFAINPDTGIAYPEIANDPTLAQSIATGSPTSGNGWARWIMNPQFDFQTIFPTIPNIPPQP